MRRYFTLISILFFLCFVGVCYFICQEAIYLYDYVVTDVDIYLLSDQKLSGRLYEIFIYLIICVGLLLFSFLLYMSRGLFKISYSELRERTIKKLEETAELSNIEEAEKVKEEQERLRKIEQENIVQMEQRFEIFVQQIKSFSTEKTIDAFSEKLLSATAKLFEASSGIIYVISNKSQLKIISSYAHIIKEDTNKIIKIGDGFVGQVAKEKKLLYLKDVPQGYIKVISGLGEATPNYLIVFPIMLKKQLFGVVELSSFKKYDKYDLQLLEKVSSYMGEVLKPLIT